MVSLPLFWQQTIIASLPSSNYAYHVIKREQRRVMFTEETQYAYLAQRLDSRKQQTLVGRCCYHYYFGGRYTDRFFFCIIMSVSHGPF